MSTLDVLADLPLLGGLDPAARRIVEDAFVPVSHPFGGVVVREGDPADAYFVVLSGSARVVKTGEGGVEVPLGRLGPGATFGELALLEGGVRTATVRASEPLEALRLDRAVFGAVLRSDPALRADLEHRRDLQARVDLLRLETQLRRLPVEAVRALAEALVPRHAEPGPLDPMPALAVVLDGRLRTVDDATTVGFHRRGDLVGDASDGRLDALTAVELLELDATHLDLLQREHPAFAELIDLRATAASRVPLDFAADVAAPEERSGEPATAPPPTATGEIAVDAELTGDAPAVAHAPAIRRFAHLRQVDAMDCGAACLAMICRHAGRRVSMTRIRDAAGTGQDGTSLLGLAAAGRELGLEPRMVKASKSRLDDLPFPVIAHWDANHWVVFVGADDRGVRIADPGRAAVRRVPREEVAEKWTGYAIGYEATPAFAEQPEEQSSVRWLLDLLRPHAPKVAVALVLALAVAGLQMLVPVLTGTVVDRVLPDRDRDLLTTIGLVLAAVLVVMTVALVAQRLLLARIAARVDTELLAYLTARLFALPASYFGARKTGDIDRRLTSMYKVRDFAVTDGVLAVTAAAQFAAAVVLMFLYSPVLTGVFFATLPLYAGMVWASRRHLRPLFESLEEAHGKHHARQIDAIKGIETVKAMGAEAGLQRLILGEYANLRQRVFRAELGSMAFTAAGLLLSFLSLALFLWAGALLVLDGRLSVGDLVAFNALVLLANGPIGVLIAFWDGFQQQAVLLRRLDDVLDREPEQGSDRSRLRAVPSLEGRVTFDHLGFAFPGPVPAKVLDDIDLEIAPGTKVAIVGRSGSGKTTLAKCLCGLYEPTSGAIRFDGVDLTDLDWRELRRHIGFVLQENHVFDDTIARNIAFGDDEPDLAAVVAAARIAAADGFISRLPLGYETKVGESGLRLSGGQRQRIAIARAVYRRPPILVMDEATSALDTESERAVKTSMDTVLEGRTSFVIAHRLSTVRDADLILVLEQGRLVERGTHEELMERRGLYHHLCSQQLDL